MAGGNPTAWRGALRRQATRRAGHGRGPSSRDGGSPAGRSHAPRCRGRALDLSGQRPELGHGRAQPDPVALGRRGREQGAVQALVVGADEQRPSHHPLRLVAVTTPNEHIGTAQRGAHDQATRSPTGCRRRRPNRCGAARRRPGRGPDRMAPRRRCGSSESASDANRSTSVVTESPRRRWTPRGRRRVPSPSRPSARRASEQVECTVGRETGRSGQIATRQSAWRTPRRWKARYTTSSRAAERRKGPAAPRTVDGTEDRDFDTVVGHAGERSAPFARGQASAWGRRDSNPHWGRFKRPASASWATPPRAPFLTESGTATRMARWSRHSGRST